MFRARLGVSHGVWLARWIPGFCSSSHRSVFAYVIKSALRQHLPPYVSARRVCTGLNLTKETLVIVPGYSSRLPRDQPPQQGIIHISTVTTIQSAAKIQH